MIDVHCHLNLHKFDEDYDTVIKSATVAGVTTIINTGTSIPSSRRAVTLAETYDNLFAIVGIHPHHADKADIEFEGELHEDWLAELKKIATSSSKVIGIGEIGMDYYAYKSNGIVDKKLQEAAYRAQIELSIELGLPLQIHNRLAWDDTLGVVLEYKQKLQDPPGMLHCFSGTVEFAKKVLGAGFYIGFDGNITYPGIPPGETTALTELVQYAPVERILVETDSPFLSPIPLRGTRNEPKNAIIIGAYIAKLKRMSYEEFEGQVEKNAREVFKKIRNSKHDPPALYQNGTGPVGGRNKL